VASPAAAATRLTAATTELAFDVELLRAVGIELVDRHDAALGRQGATTVARVAAEPDDALELRWERGVFRGAGAGRLRHRSDLVLRLAKGGEIDLRRFVLVAAAPPATFELRTAAGEPVFVVDSSHLMFDRAGERVLFRNADVRISEGLARRLGRPHLAGVTVGGFELFARFEGGPESAGAECEIDLVSPVDLQMTAIASVSQSARQAGVRVAISLSATLVNQGPGTIEWYRAIAPDGTVGAHPFLAMQLYRLDADGSFRQIGGSDVKHAFYAVNSGCSCSGGHRLFAGCGDTYGVTNNSDRYYFAPRSEVSMHPEAWASRWTSLGSHFDGFGVGPPADADDFRSHGGNAEHDAFEHRLVVAESELATPGARYFVEAWYATPRDSNVWNNLARREVTPTFDGALWTFPFADAGLALGPAVDAWVDPASPPAGAASTTVTTADGRLRLASRATDLGDGRYRYDYALFNLDLDRRIDRLAVPVWLAASPLFRGAGALPATPWVATTAGGEAAWEGGAADALDWGTLYGFSFVASAPPADGIVTLRAVESGDPASFDAAAKVPQPPLFADDFESGSPGRWTDAVGD
jgi:hypothetical protein